MLATMCDPDAGNPFNEMSLTELADAARALIRTLEERKQRTREERTALVEQTIMLLSVLVKGIEPEPGASNNPELYLRNGRGHVAVHFLLWHKEQMYRAQRAVRRRTLARAANFVLGTKARLWLGSAYDAVHDHPCHRAAQSEDELSTCLQELEAIALRQSGDDAVNLPASPST